MEGAWRCFVFVRGGGQPAGGESSRAESRASQSRAFGSGPLEIRWPCVRQPARRRAAAAPFKFAGQRETVSLFRRRARELSVAK